MEQEAPPLEDVPEDELVAGLKSQFKAQELREWMSQNGLKRERGANKQRSAELAVRQEPEEIARFLFERGAIDVDWAPVCEHHGVCGNEVPGRNVERCDECTDLSRENSRARDPVDPNDFDDMDEYMAVLYERYD
jgi:hypothetical protein